MHTDLCSIDDGQHVCSGSFKQGSRKQSLEQYICKLVLHQWSEVMVPLHEESMN